MTRAVLEGLDELPCGAYRRGGDMTVSLKEHMFQAIAAEGGMAGRTRHGLALARPAWLHANDSTNLAPCLKSGSDFDVFRICVWLVCLRAGGRCWSVPVPTSLGVWRKGALALQLLMLVTIPSSIRCLCC